MKPETPALFAAIEATWPAASSRRVGPWTIREGRGGGSRVSAATPADDGWTADDIPAAEDAMRALGQPPLFRVTEGDRLDTALAARGYRLACRTCLYAAPVAALAVEPPHLAALSHWPPLAITCDLWAASGIGPARLAVMARVAGAKTAILARSRDRPAGAAFVACADGIAALHALCVLPAFRRQGAAGHMLRRAAVWAAGEGAGWLILAVTADNAAARALYDRAGMAVAATCAYRTAEGPG